MPKFQIRNTYINQLRADKRKQVEDDCDNLMSLKEDYKGTYQRLKFLNKFYLYSELSKQYADNNLGAQEGITSQ